MTLVYLLAIQEVDFQKDASASSYCKPSISGYHYRCNTHCGVDVVLHLHGIYLLAIKQLLFITLFQDLIRLISLEQIPVKEKSNTKLHFAKD